MRLRRISAAALAVPLVFLASGCGDSSETSTPGGSAFDPKGASNVALSAADLSKKAGETFKDAKGLRIQVKGEMYGFPVSADLSLGNAQQAQGRLTLKDKGIDLVAVDKSAYVRIEPGAVAVFLELAQKAEESMAEPGEDKEMQQDFTKMFAEMAKLVEGKYLKIPGADPAKISDGGFSMDGLMEGVFGEDSEDAEDLEDEDLPSNMTKGEPTTINGVKVIPLIDKDTETNTTSILYVAANGTPLPVRMTADEKNDGKLEASIDFRFDKLTKDIAPKTPPAGETVDLESLMKSFGDDATGDDATADDDLFGSAARPAGAAAARA